LPSKNESNLFLYECRSERYRPAYPAYRPAYGYNPPPNYQWNEYNKNTNVNINNNYYAKFQNQPTQLPASSQLARGTGSPSTGDHLSRC